MRTLARRLILGALALALAGCGEVQAPHHRPTSERAAHEIAPSLVGVHWWLAASALRRLDAAAGSSWTNAVFRPANTTLIVGPSQAASYAGWAGHRALDATSLAGVREALRVATSGDVVLLDLEHWPRSPLAEQLQAGATFTQAGTLARAAGVDLVAAPATDLALVLTPGQRVRTGFLASGVVQAASRAAQILEIQAQGLEATPSRYASFVDQVEVLARSANPTIRFVLGLSTNPSGQRVSATTLAQDIALTKATASGYWLNIPQAGVSCPRCGIAQPQVAVALLRGES
ncbi:hypothetical protein Afer_0465 [Acidimicrobium ferrooxidans DSM 10331]|uniref:Lipoprotein n=1 Tax=Acidimicrobium ferrooxidans (strain DSM 10331 / JCM 15462 / NBRC 103882 / ICP) TaxID=525909 RepID=C7M339_ACIFD|nr:hypothetical protein [Acidimicrobium ferrooxidans]ACU53433.1 hypothetical protein Afer_0465 [Acidimicrobium ferrooxidans DSM 10331]